MPDDINTVTERAVQHLGNHGDSQLKVVIYFPSQSLGSQQL